MKCCYVIVVLLCCGACCQKYRHSYEPNLTGDGKTQHKYKVADVEYHIMRGGEKEDDRADMSRLKSWFDEIQNEHPETFASNGIPIKITLTDHLDPARSAPDAALFVMTLGVLPLWNRWEDKTTVEVSILSGTGSNTESVVVKRDFCETFSSSGLSYLLPVGEREDMRFSDSGWEFMDVFDSEKSKHDCWKKTYAYAIPAALAKLESSGRVRSGQGKTTDTDKKPPPQAKANDVVRNLLETKRKELEDLKKAGIIDEAEYAAEVKKLEGTGK